MLIPWEKIPYYYHIADVFVNASNSETQGLTYVEALASGVPVLVKNDPCIEDVVQEGYNGFIFDTLEECVSKMQYCIDNDLTEVKNNTEPSSRKFSKEAFAKNIYNKAKTYVKGNGTKQQISVFTNSNFKDRLESLLNRYCVLPFALYKTGYAEEKF